MHCAISCTRSILPVTLCGHQRRTLTCRCVQSVTSFALPRSLTSAACCADGSHVALGDDAGIVRIYDIRAPDAARLRLPAGLSLPVTSLSWHRPRVPGSSSSSTYSLAATSDSGRSPERSESGRTPPRAHPPHSDGEAQRSSGPAAVRAPPGAVPGLQQQRDAAPGVGSAAAPVPASASTPPRPAAASIPLPSPLPAFSPLRPLPRSAQPADPPGARSRAVCCVGMTLVYS